MRLSLTRPKSTKHQSDLLSSYLRDCKPPGEPGVWNGSEVGLPGVIQSLHMQIGRVSTDTIGLREFAKTMVVPSEAGFGRTCAYRTVGGAPARCALDCTSREPAAARAEDRSRVGRERRNCLCGESWIFVRPPYHRTRLFQGFGCCNVRDLPGIYQWSRSICPSSAWTAECPGSGKTMALHAGQESLELDFGSGTTHGTNVRGLPGS